MNERNVLIIDDEDIVLKVLERVFRGVGYTPFCTVDGNQALQLMQEHDIRVLFTDLRMPIMDGMEVCRRAKQIDTEAHVFAISAYVSAYTPQEFDEAGFSGRFGKPYDANALLKASKDAFDELSQNAVSIRSDPEEKRRAARVAIDDPVLISIIGSQRDASLVGKTFLCSKTSVSRGGIQLFADQHVEPGTDLSIHIGIEGQPKPYVLGGMARWCQSSQGETTPGSGIPVGVELLSSSRDFDRWCAFVDEMLLKKHIAP